MKTLLRAYPPALFSGSKGVIPVKLYPNILSLIGGGNPQEASSKKRGGNTMSTCHRNDNRFRGRGGIGLLHNLMLLKQRRMIELMGGSSGPLKVYHNSLIGTRQKGGVFLDGDINNSNKSLSRHEDIAEMNYNHQFMKGNLSMSMCPSFENNDGTSNQPDRKKRKQLVTTMFELLRAKPDLIEACRSHQPNLKPEFGRVESYIRKLSLEGDASTSNTFDGSSYSDNTRGCVRQRLSSRRAKNTSKTLKERMKVFERKPWKSF